MYVYSIITIIICITAVFAYINTKFLKLPNTIGLMFVSLIFSILIGGINYLDYKFLEPFINEINSLDFSAIVLNVLLSFLLFAGAMHTDFQILRKQKESVIIFAVLGVLLSTFFIGSILYGVLHLFNLQVPYLYCLLFGTIISPTDPIAVLGILTKGNVPKKIEITIVGESLFNDGIGVVLFITILSILEKGYDNFGALDILKLFSQEAFGGIAFGLLLGYIIYFLFRTFDDYETAVIITIAVVMGGTLAASALHVSAPLAMVVAGLMTGYKTKNIAMSESTELYVDKFWHLLDVLLNAILFVLMGLKVLSIHFQWTYVWLSLILIPLLIGARYLALFIPHVFTAKYISIKRKDLTLMTWGGLRGGLSMAMALSLSNEMAHKNLFVAITYGIVLFSILVQGLTVQQLVKKLYH